MKWMRLLPMILLLISAQPSWSQDCTGNESWLPIGEGIPHATKLGATMNGQLYTIYSIDGPQRSIHLATWNGVTWGDVSSFTGSNFPETMTAFNNEIYVGGRFSNPPTNPATPTRLMKWNGTQWVSVADFNGPLWTIKTFNNILYVGGDFTAVNSLRANAIATYDGNNWGTLGDGLTVGPGDSAIVWTMDTLNGDLYVGGYFANASGQAATNIARWDGSAWSAVGQGVLELDALVSDGTSLYAYGSDLYVFAPELYLFARWDGTSWYPLQDVPNIRGGSIAAYNGSLYVGIAGPGRDSIPEDSGGVVVRYNGTSWQPVSCLNAGIQAFLVDDNGLLAFGDFTESCGNSVNHIARLCDAGNCARITGTIYHDVNANCTRDVGDPGLKRRMVEIQPGPFHAVTDSLGNYSTFVLPGTYTVDAASHLYWNVVCPVVPYSVTLSGAGDLASGNEFAMTPMPGIHDLRVSVAGSRPRPGFGIIYTIGYENVGTETLSGTISMGHDGRMTLDSSQPAASRYTSPVGEWDFSDLKVGDAGVIRVHLTLSRDAQLGTEACVTVWSNLDNADQALDDNRDTLCDSVRGSYDPNDISVTPVGTVIDDGTFISPSDTVLTYQVRFQNTGTDTAFRVVVLDTLSTHLDVTTIRLLSSSHPYTFGLSEDGVLRFAFENILLPDSNTSEVNSHGYLKYSVHLKRQLPPGTEIANRAAIYFDFNAPVITNTVVSVPSEPASVPTQKDIPGFQVWPNPTRGGLRISIEQGFEGEIELQTMLGEPVRRWETLNGGEMVLDLAGLPAGTYLIRLVTSHGTALERVTLVR